MTSMEDDPFVQEVELKGSWLGGEWRQLMNADWYKFALVLALTVQTAMFVSFGVAAIYAFFTDNALLAIFLALLAVMLKPSGK